MLFTMTYRDRQLVKQGYVEAGSEERAVELGKAWCDAAPGRKYISLRDAVLVRETAARIDDQRVVAMPVSPGVKSYK